MSTLKTNNIQHVDRSDPSIIINTDGSVNIAGTMTYEDVTNVDAVGIITGRSNIDAQKQVHVGTGVSVKAGGINVTAGITTVQALQATTGTFTGDVTVTGTTPSILLTDTDNNPDYLIKNGNGEFNIQDATASANRLSVNSSGNVVVGSDLIIPDKIVHTSDTNTAIRFPAADTISFETGGSERARVTSGGNLLVATQGTTNISANADDIIIGTHDDTGLERGLTFAGTVAAGIRWNDGSDAGVIEYAHSDNSMRFSTASGERLRINSTGNVGIDQTNPGALLHIQDFSSDGYELKMSGNAIQFNRASLSYIDQANDSGKIVFRMTSSNTEALRIDENGKIGINEDSPDNIVHIKDGNPFVEIEGTSNSGDAGIFLNAKANHWLVRADNSSSPNTFSIKDGTVASSTHRLTVAAGTGNVTLNTGNLVIGTSGKGIAFAINTDQGETNTSTLLDDYEEGTWTPHFEIETRDASDSPVDGVQGRYVKVGNVVTCHYQLSCNGTPSERSTSRAWEIQGFPYTSVDGNTSGQMGGNQRVTGYETATYGPDGHFVFRLFNNTTYGRLEFIEHNYNGTRNASPMMLDDAQVIGTITYQTI